MHDFLKNAIILLFGKVINKNAKLCTFNFLHYSVC